MSDVIEEVIEGNIEAIEGDGSGLPSKVEVKKKKPYVLSPLRLEALAKAREKAFSPMRPDFGVTPG